jgi:hypothetical protein
MANVELALRPLALRLKATRRVKGSKPEKIAFRCMDIFGTVTDLRDYRVKNEEWRDWKEGLYIQTAFISPPFRERLLRIVEDVEGVVRDKVREEFTDTFVRKAPRVYPVYLRVLDFLIDNPEYLALYEARPMEAYREIAKELGISWRSVRDGFWAMRGAGIV